MYVYETDEEFDQRMEAVEEIGENALAEEHDLHHEPQEAPVIGCHWCQEESAKGCDGCGRRGVALSEYEDDGDPNVGYGPLTNSLCAECAEHQGAL